MDSIKNTLCIVIQFLRDIYLYAVVDNNNVPLGLVQIIIRESFWEVSAEVVQRSKRSLKDLKDLLCVTFLRKVQGKSRIEDNTDYLLTYYTLSRWYALTPTRFSVHRQEGNVNRSGVGYINAKHPFRAF